MEHLYLTIIFIFTLFFLLGSGVWIGLALIGVAYVGMEIFTVRPAGDAPPVWICVGGARRASVDSHEMSVFFDGGLSL